MSKLYIILENIRSVHNTGAIFRTADAVGVEKVFLYGTTPAPVDRFNRKRADFAKTSLGAEESVNWEYIKESECAISELIKKIKLEGYKICCVEQTDNSEDYKSISKYGEKLALVFGNEVDGVSSEALALADHVLELPMLGKKESLNVAVVAGIMMFEATRTTSDAYYKNVLSE
jgi:tRNA G18 (ribose-2'-O)-methylase SpoU